MPRTGKAMSPREADMLRLLQPKRRRIRAQLLNASSNAHTWFFFSSLAKGGLDLPTLTRLRPADVSRCNFTQHRTSNRGQNQ